MATKYVSGRVKELKVGITNYSESKESLSVIGIVSATEYYGDGSNLTGTSTPGIDTTGSSTFNNLNATHLKVTGVSTYQGDLDIESSVLITGITTIGGLVDINAGGQANTFKVEDLTSGRVVYAGAGGELQDSANLTFDGTTLTASSFDGAISEWVLGANGSSDYTFTGPGLTGAENDPTIYLKRGQKYNFKNSMGAHPFQIRTAINGSAYNDGIVNNGVSNGTLTWNVQFDAPDILYYQCTAHAGMVGKIYIGNSGDTATFDGDITANGNIVGDNSTNISGIASVTATSFHGDGSSLTGIDASSLSFGGAVKAQANASGVVVTGVLTATTFKGPLEGNVTGNVTGNINGDLTGTLQTAAQPNVTSLGTIASLTASSAKVSDLTNGRVVYAGASGELQDSSNLTFNGSTLTAGAFAGDGSQLTNLPGIDTAGGSTFNDVFSSGINTLGKGATGRTFLYDADVLKFQTTGLGVTVYGTTQTQQLNVSGVSTFTGIYVQDDSGNNDVIIDNNFNASHVYLTLKDNCKAQFGNGTDLQIYHDGSDSYVIDQGTGNVIIGANDSVRITDGAGTENKIVATTNGSVDLYHDNSVRLKTTGIGITVAGVGNTAYITGPDEIWIDPSPMGVGTTSGVVRIRGDLYVDGKEVIIDVDKLEIGDFQIGIASTAGTNVQLDGAGIGIGSVSIRKSITWNNATSALMCSENWNLGSGKHYEIAGTDVLTATTLGSGVVNSSLTSLGTIASLTASTAKVSDLTNTRVVYAGASGELQDSSNLTFNGTTLTANAFAGNGAALTNITVTGINTGASSDFTDLVVSGNLNVTGITTLGNPAANNSTFINASVAGNAEGNTLNIGHGSGNNAGLTVQSATSYVGSLFFTDTDTGKEGGIQYYHGLNALKLYASETEYLALDSNGVTVSNGSFFVHDKITHAGDTDTHLRFPAADTFTVEVGGTERLRVVSSGIVVTGTCQAADFNSTSDIRLKDNIQVIEDPLAKLVQIEGVSFNWKENNKPALGVIADQVQEILPELVTDGDPKTVNYNGLIGLLIEAVKEQQIQIDELKSKLP